MALRVLLADESSTIKRVMQLALQDYAVEVKAVPIGVDVLPVAKAFLPDIIFADVLLPKRNGYEVGKDLKKDPQTKNIPLVLMWSGFMEIDEAKAQESKADRRLEKPFEPETLRSIVQELVKKTQSSALNSFLTFPKMPEFEEAKQAQQAPPPAQPETPVEDVFSLEIDAPSEMESQPPAPPEFNSLDVPEEDFSQVPLHNASRSMPSSESQEEWSQEKIENLNIRENTADTKIDLEQKFRIPEEDLQKAEVNVHGDFEEITFVKAQPLSEENQVPFQSDSAPTGDSPRGKLDPLMAEKIMREEARQIIESIAWKIIPEIAERIVREEINKLLQDTEKSI